MIFKELAENLEMELDEFLEIMELFIESATSDLGQMETGIGEGNSEKSARAAHSIKGAAANLGLTEIYEMAARAEMQAHEKTLDKMNETIRTMRGEIDQIATAIPGPLSASGTSSGDSSAETYGISRSTK